MQVGSRVRVIGPMAEVYPGFFLVTVLLGQGVVTLDNGEDFHLRFLQEIPVYVAPTYPRTAMPVELVITRLPMSVWKSLRDAAVADTTVRAGLKKLKNALTINLDANATINWCAYCVTNGFLTQAQSDALLA